MARISGIDLPRDKRIEIGLTYIKGIGLTTSRKILKNANVDFDKRVKDLRRIVSLNIKRLTDIKCYRGIRHLKGLPVRGQRTKTNARTRKGPCKTIAGKKKEKK